MSSPPTYYREDGTVIDRQQVLDWCVEYAGDKHIGRTFQIAVEAVTEGGKIIDNITRSQGISGPTKGLLEMLRGKGVYRVE